MTSSGKLDGKPKNEEVIREIHRVGEVNSLRLQQLEVAVANLTSICNGLREDMCSLGANMSGQGSVREAKTEATEVKLESVRSSSPALELKDQMLADQMQQLVDQAAVLGMFKDVKATPAKLPGQAKNLRVQTSVAPKIVQATTTQISLTKPRIQTKESTTQQTMHITPGAVMNGGATQPKEKTWPQIVVKNKKPITTGKVSLKSTVKRTKTTISEVVVTNKNTETSTSNISVKSSIQNVKTLERKGSMKMKKLTDKSQSATKSRDLVKTSLSIEATTMAKPDLKPRRRWSTTRETTLIK